jgi:hypothetical protein
MTIKSLLLAALLTAVVGVPIASAHHGGAAFDQSKSVTLQGTVSEVQFANPHVLIFFEVQTDGGTTKWSGELTAPNKLERAGWTKRTLKPGDHIVVTGTPHKEGAPLVQIRKLVGPDGATLPLSEN